MDSSKFRCDPVLVNAFFVIRMFFDDKGTTTSGVAPINIPPVAAAAAVHKNPVEFTIRRDLGLSANEYKEATPSKESWKVRVKFVNIKNSKRDDTQRKKEMLRKLRYVAHPALQGERNDDENEFVKTLQSDLDAIPDVTSTIGELSKMKDKSLRQQDRPSPPESWRHDFYEEVEELTNDDANSVSRIEFDLCRIPLDRTITAMFLQYFILQLLKLYTDDDVNAEKIVATDTRLQDALSMFDSTYNDTVTQNIHDDNYDTTLNDIGRALSALKNDENIVIDSAR